MFRAAVRAKKLIKIVTIVSSLHATQYSRYIVLTLLIKLDRYVNICFISLFVYHSFVLVSRADVVKLALIAIEACCVFQQILFSLISTNHQIVVS